uniref:Serine aminopeptidase S33 domain-containing protein n=1 Tax=Chromera velia CCMP2878 TaxID=1169474 RepID=A0A0G4FRX9_9ALVE|mmetsp:Transcript_54097/g.105872  ORF Transcript_54097/g.105872 Transcript_54097/m.105872 type:complete len:382 (-) Transcript_54097:269-1414(-)|eukprot:Cvel_18294.t1-p1 / transcript=Cvel_18294.t1 / gene=Cvel_18294 / organism=Chromera_velia_CCMP2878 / gene_product=Monoglyceride lipase, putative / transcript_product=Monoglyceride lipase, putative / location=Cvel_scaffold1508:24196-25338(-) / protein_length=381 / sequence_SO=supercontig / SO=protein_coding / is_pseudo=false
MLSSCCRRRRQEEGAPFPPVPEPVYKDGNPERKSFLNKKKLRVIYYEWKAKRPSACVIAVHGITSHARLEWLTFPGTKYEGSWVEAFLQKNITFVGVDQQGHGLSEGWKGERCAMERVDDLVDDLEHVVASVRASDTAPAPLPLFILGMSMGGCVTTLLLERPQTVSKFSIGGAVLLAPMLSLDRVRAHPVNRMLEPLGFVLTTLFPNLPVSPALGPNEKYPWMDEVILGDPLRYQGKQRARVCTELIRGTDQVQRDAHLVRSPLLLIHSKDDGPCEVGGTMKLFARLSNCKEKTLDILTGGEQHMIHAEPGHERVFEKVGNWISARALTAEPTQQQQQQQKAHAGVKLSTAVEKANGSADRLAPGTDFIDLGPEETGVGA